MFQQSSILATNSDTSRMLGGPKGGVGQHMLLSVTHLRCLQKLATIPAAGLLRQCTLFVFTRLLSILTSCLSNKQNCHPITCLMTFWHSQHPGHQISMMNSNTTSMQILSTSWMSFHGGLKDNKHIQPSPVWPLIILQFQVHNTIFLTWM